MRNEKGEVTTDTAEIESILRDYYKQLYDINHSKILLTHLLEKWK